MLSVLGVGRGQVGESVVCEKPRQAAANLLQGAAGTSVFPPGFRASLSNNVVDAAHTFYDTRAKGGVMAFRRYAIWIVITALIAGAGLWIDHATREAAIVEAQAQKEKDANAIVAARQFNEQWEKSFDKTGKYPERQDPGFHVAMLNIVGEIYRRDESAIEAKELRDKLWERQKKIDDHEKILRKQRIENDASGRKKFAEHLETTFLKGGRDLSARVSGPKNTILDVKYILFNRPAIYQLQNDTEFFQNAWAAGFKKVILRNGIGDWSDSWTFTSP